MTQRLHSKIAIVTGGLSGIGEAVARRLVEEGAIVIAADLATDATALGEGPLSPLQVDVADPTSVDAMVRAVVERHGRLDCLVNSAGIAAEIPFLETSLETFDRIVAVNLRGTFLVGQAAARAMRETGGGVIVNVASISGMIGSVGRSAYGGSKGGVVVLSRVMAVDLAVYGIRVNVSLRARSPRQWWSRYTHPPLARNISRGFRSAATERRRKWPPPLRSSVRMMQATSRATSWQPTAGSWERV